MVAISFNVFAPALGTGSIGLLFLLIFYRLKGFSIYLFQLSLVVLTVITTVLYVALAQTLELGTMANGIAGVAFVLSMMVVGYLLTTVWVKTIQDLTENAKTISEGVLTVETQQSARFSEFVLLANTFHEMVGFLRNVLQEIQDVTSTMDTSVDEVSTASEEINASSEEIASISQQISRGAQEQTSLVHHSISVGREFQATMEQKLKEVTSATKELDGLAGEVNMLALNASIEAARAGEYGRGFTVVAENIQNLAIQSKSTVQNIQDQIQAITHLLTTSIQDFVSSVEKISVVSEQTAAGSEEASSATEEQSASMEELSSTAQKLTEHAELLSQVVGRFTT